MPKNFLLISLASGLVALSGCGTKRVSTSANNSSATSLVNSASSAVASTSFAAIIASPSKLTADHEKFLKKYHLAEPTGLRPMGKFKMNDVSEEGGEGNFDSIVCGYLSPGPEFSAGEFGDGSYQRCAFLNAVDVYDAEVKQALGKEAKIALVDGIYDKTHPNRLAFSPSDLTQEQLELFSALYGATAQKPLCVKISFGTSGGADGVCSGTAIKLEPVTSASDSRQ